MRVLHVSPSVARSYGGPTYSLVGYAGAVGVEGEDISIAAPRPPGPDIDWLSAELPRAKLELFPSHGRNAFVAAPRLHAWLRSNGATFDVIHVHGLLNSISSFAARLCVHEGWPIAIRPFGTLSTYTASHRRVMLKQLYFALLGRPVLRHTSAMHFTTSVERDESRRHGIEWGSRAFVIPPPIIDVRRDLPRPGRSSSNVLVIARLHPVKHLELLLDAWAMVAQSLPGARLVIAGDGAPNYVQSLRGRLSGDAAESVAFVGTVEGSAKQTLLAESDLFVLPSHHENFGIAVLEAIDAGLPVVITPTVQLAAFVRQNGLGLVVESYPLALAAAIVSALGDQKLRERCRSEGPRIVAECFSRTSIGWKLEEMYRFAIAHPTAQV